MTSISPPFSCSDVEKAFQAFPEEIRLNLLCLRAFIFEVAASIPTVGQLEETLKWGQPAYLTSETKSGTPIRLGAHKKSDFAVFVHCQTCVVADFKHLFPDDFTFEGSRAILFRVGDDIAFDKLRFFIKQALTYHQR